MNEQHPTRVLFVDDESCILDGLRRQLRPLHRQWEMRFAQSGDEALRMLEEQAADVVVSDMRMPGMGGLQLLEKVHERWPETARIILSGQTDQADLLSDIGVVHQFLQKPCESEVLRAAIARAASVTRLVEVPAMRRIVSGLRSLPVLAESLQELMTVLQDSSSDVGKISEVVQKDVGLSTKLLQLVNSAFFGRPRAVTSVREVVSLIGASTLRQIALAARTFDALERGADRNHVIEMLWLHSSDLAALAGRMCRERGFDEQAQARARLAASLSLVGMAVVARYMPAQFEAARLRAMKHGVPFGAALRVEVSVPYQLIGAYAIGLWAFEDDVVRAIAFQCEPEKSDVWNSADPLHFLHLARVEMPRSEMVDAVELSRGFVSRFEGPNGVAQSPRMVA